MTDGNILVMDYSQTGYTYEFDETTGEATVTGFTPENADAEIMAVPHAMTKDGKLYRVTAVGNDAFAGNEKIIAAVIPTGVTTIGDGAFSGCSALAGLNLPENVATVGDGAFAFMPYLSEVTVNSATPLELQEDTDNGYGGVFRSSEEFENEIGMSTPVEITLLRFSWET